MALTAQQTHWGQQIVAIIKSHGLPLDQGQRAADIALAAAMTESGLQMYANGWNRESLALPHDAVGWDHGSVGLFQQQVGGAPNSTANWGTTQQCMDVGYSTNAFLRGLLSKNWLHMTNWDAAQAVQGSYDPTGGNYKRNDAEAIALRKMWWGSVQPVPPVVPHPAPKPTPVPPAHGVVGYYTVRPGDTLTSIAHLYPQVWITAASIAALNHIANMNLIYVGQSLKIG